MKGYHDSKTPMVIRDLWMTPKFVFDFYDRRFNFKCDFAASADNTLCEHYFSAPDGMDENKGALFASPLDMCLCGNVWCNPPYSDIMPWVKKCHELSVQTGIVFVMLIPADTSVAWFKYAFDNCAECHLISGRLSFINEETRKPVSGNNKGSVVFIFDQKSPIRKRVILIDRDSMKEISE